MIQQLFRNLGLLQVTEGKFSQLFSISKTSDDDKAFVVQVLPFLPEPQVFLKVYPEARLIVTQDKLMTLEGKILLQYEKAKLSVELVSDKWLIIEDALADSDGRYRITFWDGEKESSNMFGRYFLRNEKYLAVYTSSDNGWRVLTYDGKFVRSIKNVGTDIRICGDFLLISGIGNYTAYALAQKNNNGQPVFENQQMVLCSNWIDFILYSNVQGFTHTYYRGKYRQLGKIDSVELYDRAGVYVVKKNGRYFLYKFNGKPVAANICPYGADKVAYNQDENTILINTNGVFHLI